MKSTWIVSGVMLISTTLLAGCGPKVGSNPVLSGSTNHAAGGEIRSEHANPVPLGVHTKNAATVLVKQSMILAKQGKVIDIPFAVQRNIAVVQHAWGQPDRQNSAGAGIYAVYRHHSAAFGLNKGEQIFDIRSFSSKLKVITPLAVESVFGRPGDTRHTSDSIIYMYPAGADYQLLFVFPKTSTGQPGKALDHVSVFWPQGTINNMAATQAAPSIVIDNAPGSTGSLFTFTLQNPPTGYRLVELEWLPMRGRPVVNTLQQALENGSSGAIIPGFSISPDGQTYSFIYPLSLRGQTGTVRVIYQGTSGAAMIGNSPSVTLK